MSTDVSGLMQMLPNHPDSPGVSDPLVLGFSADVAAEIIRLSSRSVNVLLRVSQTPPGIGRRVSVRPDEPSVVPTCPHARERLQALKSRLADADLAGAAALGPLRDFLRQEWDELLHSVSSLASASLLELSALSRLERRAELLGAYLGHRGASDPPAAYRLSAFRNGRGFLAAVVREAARVRRKHVSEMSLQCQVK